MIWLFHEVKQRRSRLVPGWVTALLDSVDDPVHASFRGSGGMGDDITIISGPTVIGKVFLVCYIGSGLGFAYWGLCDFGAKSREEGEKYNGYRYIDH